MIALLLAKTEHDTKETVGKWRDALGMLYRFHSFDHGNIDMVMQFL